MINRVILYLALLVVAPLALAEGFKVGFAEREVTPTKDRIPMWGYGARHALPGEGVDIPQFAKTVVIEAGGKKLGIMGLDLGRSPTYASMDRIKAAVKEKAGIDWVLISGSHTHHGPVLELLDQEGYGKGKYDNAVAYVGELEGKIIDAFVEAAGRTVAAKVGWTAEDTDLNRNRHAKTEPKPRDPELSVVRFDDLAGKPIALFVGLAAHPTIASTFDRRWSAEWPGAMQRELESSLGIKSFFMQGAEGDMSPNTNEQRKGVEGFGLAVAEKVKELNTRIVTSVPATPSIKAIEEEFAYTSRIDMTNPFIIGTFKNAFFPEITAMLVELKDNTVRPRMSTVVLNGELAMVSGSGEFFSAHAVRLKKDSPAKETLFFGLCNGHNMYFPTREAIAQGGYGADPTVSWVSEGAGEEMIDKALANIAELLK